MTRGRLPGDWDGLIVLGAANNWDGVKLGDQHMAERLADLAPVLYIDPPMSHLTPRNHPALAGALRGQRLRLLGPRLARFTPIMPPMGRRPLLAPLTDRLVRGQFRRAVGQLTDRVSAVVAGGPDWSLFGACGEGIDVYWAQDDFVKGAELMGLDAGWVARREQAVAASASLIMVSSPHVRDQWAQRGRQTVLIPFGCDSTVFASVPAPQAGAAPLASQPEPDGDIADGPSVGGRPAAPLPRPVAGFVGHINARIDIDLLEAVVAAGASLLLVGPMDAGFEPDRMGQLLSQPTVHWTGPVPYSRLAGYLAIIDTGLVPYTRSGFNLGSFPLKTLEYLSAGVPPVSTDLPSTRWFNTDLIAIADEPTRFAQVVLEQAERRSDPAAIERRRAFAGQHDWASRARAMLAAIEAAQR